VEIGPWTLEVDRELTASNYRDLRLISESCHCTYCLNFVSAYDHFPPFLKEFFDEFGIDPRKEGEVYHFQDDGEAIYSYAGFFHFVGRIIQTSNDSRLHSKVFGSPNLYFNMFGPFEVNFNTENQLVQKSFPKPLVQLNFLNLELPWMFDLPANELFKQLYPEKWSDK
jgi:hypothetical protein